MIIAIPCIKGKIAESIGKADEILFYNAENLKIKVREAVQTQGIDIYAALAERKTAVIICKGITEEQRAKISQHGIVVFENADGNADSAAEGFLDGSLFARVNDGCGKGQCGSCGLCS